VRASHFFRVLLDDLLPTTPPLDVVPYRFPSLAWIRAATGKQPSMLQSKECRVVKVPAGVILNTVPYPAAPPSRVVP
jgi:hypothetical protein